MTPTTPTPDRGQVAAPPTSRRAPTTPPDAPRLQRRIWLPDPATLSGALLYAILAGLIVWLVVYRPAAPHPPDHQLKATRRAPAHRVGPANGAHQLGRLYHPS